MSGGMYQGGIKELAAEAAPRSLPHPDAEISVDNPFCGDRVDLQVALENGRVTALARRVRGCLLCQAAANALARSAVGLDGAQIARADLALKAMLRGEAGPGWPPPGWESLAVFEPVQKHRSRHGCVTLPFRALLEALASVKAQRDG